MRITTEHNINTQQKNYTYPESPETLEMGPESPEFPESPEIGPESLEIPRKIKN